MIGNGEIASVLEELAKLTVLEDGSVQSFRVRAYETAARSVEAADTPVAEMTLAELEDLRGVGTGTARRIRELVETGSIGRLDALRRRFPPGFVALTRVRGIGPKTALLLREHLGVESVEDLRAAVADRRVRTLPGFGPKTEENLGRSLDRLGIARGDGRRPIADALRIARDVTAALRTVPGVERVEVMGSLRRFRDTIGDIDVIVISSLDPDPIMVRFVSMPVVRDVVAYGARKSAIISPSGIQIDVRVVRPDQFGAAAIYFTGSKAHNVRLRRAALARGWTLNEYALSEIDGGGVIAAATEEDVYAALEMEWIPPEIREDLGEIELAASGTLPSFVAEEDLRGDLHVHTDLSGDARDSLEDMVAAAAARGYEYVAITDHGEDLRLNGASRAEMRRQRERIGGLRGAFDRMAILHGVELNIGPGGGIDYDEEFLAGFDWGVAGVHSHFDLDRQAQTRRLITAMKHPAVNAIAHLTGRRIGMRPGIDLDVDAVLAAAAETGCALEVNCHLDRLDAPAEILRRASDREVLLVIDTDAHDTRELANAVWGVRHARRGWVRPERVVNTWPRERFLRWAAATRALR